MKPVKKSLAELPKTSQSIRELLLNQQYVKAASLLLNPTIDLQSIEKQQFIEYLAAILLTEELPKLEEILSANSTLHVDKKYIKQAISAYCQQDDPQPYLKQIPFRSPYRNFSAILKAMHTGENFQISPNSVYIQFVELLKLSRQGKEGDWEKIKALPPQAFKFFCYSQGWQAKQFNLLTQLKKQNSPKSLFNLLTKYNTLLGNEYTQKFCFKILPYYSKGIAIYEQTFAPLSAIDKSHIQALIGIQEHDIIATVENWYAMVIFLLEGPDLLESSGYQLFAKLPKKIDHISPQHRYKAAIILRYLVDLVEDVYFMFNGDNEIIIQKKIYLLTESLRLDPADKASYIKLIQLVKSDKKLYSFWIEASIAQFPHDVDLLLLAVQAAFKSKAFKKTIDLINIILKYDPINVEVKQLLLFSHLSLARKQIKTKKYHLAHAALHQAAQIRRITSCLVPINQGWLAVLEEEFEAANNYFATALKIIQEPLLQAIYLTVEGQQIQLDEKLIKHWIKQLVQFKASDQLSTHSIMQAIDILEYYYDQSLPNLFKITSPFILVLSKKIKNCQFTDDEILDLCAKLADMRLFQLLEAVVKRGLMQSKNSPRLLYYKVFAKTQANPKKLMRDKTATADLKKALTIAHLQNDKQTIALICNYF